jgi:hypothetical protein
VSDGDRYSRQTRLREVGVHGQARLAQATLSVQGREAAETETRYLERAGVRAVRSDPDAAPQPFAHAAIFRNPACRNEAAAAWRALQKTLAVLNEVGG